MYSDELWPVWWICDENSTSFIELDVPDETAEKLAKVMAGFREIQEEISNEVAKLQKSDKLF